MTTLSETEAQVLDWLAAQGGAMLDFVRTLVDIDSGSYDKAGVDAVGARVLQFLSARGIASSVIPSRQFGDVLRVPIYLKHVNFAQDAFQRVGLLGHRDAISHDDYQWLPRTDHKHYGDGFFRNGSDQAYRRVKNDQRDAADLADLLRMGRLPEAWITPPPVRELRELTRYRAKVARLFALHAAGTGRRGSPLT